MSLTWTWKRNAPVSFVVPETTPVDLLSLNPWGRDPESFRVHGGFPPIAFSVGGAQA